MAMRHEDLTEEQLELQRAYQSSWDAAQEALADPEYRAWLEENIERVNRSSAKPITGTTLLESIERSRCVRRISPQPATRAP